MLFTGVYLGVSIVRLFLRKIRFFFCAQALEGETAESKAAYKQHRWEMRRKRRVPRRHMSEGPAQKHLCLKNAFWRADSGPHSVPVRNSSCVPSENTEKTKVNLAAAQQYHCSGLLYSPYLMADPSRPLMACWPHPPSGCHLGLQTPKHKRLLAPLPPLANDFLSLYTTPPECLLAPLPASTDDEFSRPQTPAHECLLLPLPPLANDFLSLYATPPECLLTPLPASTDDEFSRPQTPAHECLLPLPPLANDFLSPYVTPPECLLTPLPASTDDEFSRPQMPAHECLLSLPPLANDFLNPYSTPPECLLTPLPASTDDEFSRPQTPAHECLVLPLPPLANDFLSPYTTPPECLLTPLPADLLSQPTLNLHLSVLSDFTLSSSHVACETFTITSKGTT
ncbi:nuclear pore complex-interacting protein family member B3-like [Aotus nancymaae]|uniref:nuclear pore complex-interacting protein family member B3-like n=1 Tax=Aotus nancymaae TaxID=37293 RepID=UPI0030FF3D08